MYAGGFGGERGVGVPHLGGLAGASGPGGCRRPSAAASDGVGPRGAATAARTRRRSAPPRRGRGAGPGTTTRSRSASARRTAARSSSVERLVEVDAGEDGAEGAVDRGDRRGAHGRIVAPFREAAVKAGSRPGHRLARAGPGPRPGIGRPGRTRRRRARSWRSPARGGRPPPAARARPRRATASPIDVERARGPRRARAAAGARGWRTRRAGPSRAAGSVRAAASGVEVEALVEPADDRDDRPARERLQRGFGGLGGRRGAVVDEVDAAEGRDPLETVGDATETRRTRGGPPSALTPTARAAPAAASASRRLCPPGRRSAATGPRSSSRRPSQEATNRPSATNSVRGPVRAGTEGDRRARRAGRRARRRSYRRPGTTFQSCGALVADDLGLRLGVLGERGVAVEVVGAEVRDDRDVGRRACSPSPSSWNDDSSSVTGTAGSTSPRRASAERPMFPATTLAGQRSGASRGVSSASSSCPSCRSPRSSAPGTRRGTASSPSRCGPRAPRRAAGTASRAGRRGCGRRRSAHSKSASSWRPSTNSTGLPAELPRRRAANDCGVAPVGDPHLGPGRDARSGSRRRRRPAGRCP